MTYNKLVEDIISTYDLPNKLKNKITRIATEQIDRFGLHRFDDVYEYISNLVEKFKVPFREKSAIRGNKLASSDSKETFYDLRGIEDSVLSNLFEESENLSRTKSLDEIICILESSLDKLNVERIRRLFNGNLLFYIREEEIIAKAPKIRERFRELMDTYERDGKLIIPRRPIARIQFNPLLIKFKRRNYHGDPLGFFRKHGDVYDGVSRSELRLFDPALRLALWKAGQIHIAIPKDNRYISEKEASDIIEMFHVCDGNATLVSKNLGRGRNTVVKYLKLKGLKPYKRLSCRNPLYFFDIDRDLYEGLSRREFSIVNPGLYKALLKTGQINIAIPKLRKVERLRKTA